MDQPSSSFLDNNGDDFQSNGASAYHYRREPAGNYDWLYVSQPSMTTPTSSPLLEFSSPLPPQYISSTFGYENHTSHIAAEGNSHSYESISSGSLSSEGKENVDPDKENIPRISLPQNHSFPLNDLSPTVEKSKFPLDDRSPLVEAEARSEGEASSLEIAAPVPLPYRTKSKEVLDGLNHVASADIENVPPQFEAFEATSGAEEQRGINHLGGHINARRLYHPTSAQQFSTFVPKPVSLPQLIHQPLNSTSNYLHQSSLASTHVEAAAANQLADNRRLCRVGTVRPVSPGTLLALTEPILLNFASDSSTETLSPITPALSMGTPYNYCKPLPTLGRSVPPTYVPATPVYEQCTYGPVMAGGPNCYGASPVLPPQGGYAVPYENAYPATDNAYVHNTWGY